LRPLVPANRDLIKAMNQNLLLNIVRQSEPLSRTQLTELSGLSVGAVSQITNELIDAGWLLEIGEGEYTGGRRQTMLRLNPAAGYAVGVKLMENRLVCAVTDFASRIIFYRDFFIGSSDYPDVTADNIAQVVDKTLAEAGVERETVLGVGIGLAGVINPQSGIVRYSPFFGWHDFPLAQHVHTHLNLPIYVENDVNTLTLSEQLFGAGRRHSNFVVVTIGRGIGMGMVINGQLYQGARGGAGELGHIVLNLTLARAGGNGEHGTLEMLASDPAVVKAVSAQNMPEVNTLADVVALANAGNVGAREALAQSGEYVGIGLATVINMLCPPLIVISGEGVVAGDYRLNAMHDAMRRYTFDGLIDGVEVVVEPTDDQAWARGAASLVIGKTFESPLAEAQQSS
jgi:N-acetylglucosamine repressor